MSNDQVCRTQRQHRGSTDNYDDKQNKPVSNMTTCTLGNTHSSLCQNNCNWSSPTPSLLVLVTFSCVLIHHWNIVACTNWTNEIPLQSLCCLNVWPKSYSTNRSNQTNWHAWFVLSCEDAQFELALKVCNNVHVHKPKCPHLYFPIYVWSGLVSGAGYWKYFG